MTYNSQRVAYPYFILALLLFGLQVLVGLWLATNYFATVPQSVVDAFPFATARAMHTNLVVLWLLLGFMGATFFLVPEETGSELAWPKLAIAQLVLLAATGVTALIGFYFGWTKGRPLLEIPFPLNLLIVVAGLVFLAVMYLFGVPFYRNLAEDWYYWWWVIHLWVEGAWELVTAALVAFILIKLTGVDRKVVEKWLYVELGLFLFTGIAGTGHHYYWLGAPKYWLWIGGVFSALEPLPILLMLVDTWRYIKHRSLPIRPRLTWFYLVGMAILHFVGAGLMGFAHTLPMINYYTHGSQVTVAHGHLSFFGAYVLVNLTFFYFAIPRLKGFPDGDYDELSGQLGFWLMSLGIVGMTLAFGVAGVLQTYLERIQGQPYMVAQQPIRFWMFVAAVHGLMLLAGTLITIKHLLTLKPARPVAA